MGYIGKLTAQEAQRLLELIEKLQQKGDVSEDGSDNCCIIDLENFSAEKYKEAYDSTQNGKFLLIKPSKESIFISTYNTEEKQKDNKKYFRSELESIMNYDNGPGNRGLSVYRINITFYNDGTFEVDDSYNILLNKEGDGKKFLSNDGTYKEINASSIYTNPNTIILSFTSNGETMEDDQYALLVDSCDNNKKLKVDFSGDNIVTLDAYAIQRMADNTITFHTHEISYTNMSQNSYNETIMTWIVKPDKSIKLLYRETSLS